MKKKVLAVLGSPRKKSYSSYLANQVIKRLQAGGTEVDVIKLYDLEIKPCLACESCRKAKSNFCIQDDDMKPLYSRILESDALLLACPIYYFSVNAKMKLFIDRFYAFNNDTTGQLKDKKFGVILSYGDTDPYSSGAVNAIRMFEDAFKYTESKLCKVLYKTEVREMDRKQDPSLMEEITGFSEVLL